MIDYNKKAELINSSLFNEYKKVRKSIQFFLRYGNEEDNIGNLEIINFDENAYTKAVKEKNIYDYRTALKLDNFYDKQNHKDWQECRKIYNAHIDRVKRVKDRITKIFNSGSCIFLTLTFSDKSLSKTSAKTRREYVNDFLCKNSIDYVGNIDFGKKNEREHYHAVVQCDKVDNTLWKYGLINFERIRNNTEDTARISQYIAKLVNHAIKETTRQCRLLYPKKKKTPTTKVASV